MKKAIERGLLGFPLGVAIGYTITIGISMAAGGGDYLPAVPSLVAKCGSEINAVILQFILSGILGAASAAGSAIWENDRWSLLKMTFVHFLILSLAMLPIAYLAHWMPHTLWGFVIYFTIFIVIYAIIWAVLYAVWRRKIKRLNDGIMKHNQRKG
mgnify:CR=1 FL=1